MNKTYTAELDESLRLIDTLRTCISQLHKNRFTFHPLIIDREKPEGWHSDDPAGYRKAVEVVEHQHATLEAMAESDVPPRDDPLPAVQGLVTFWKQLLLARGPITGVRTNMKGKEREEGFVDVIARGGSEWIRIYTKKPSQLVAEFREQDSYATSDFEDSDSDSEADGSGLAECSTKTRGGLRNSILSSVESLRRIGSTIARPPGRAAPTLTLRLSRIPEHPEGGHEDDRIPATFEAIRAMDVKLVFGDLTEHDLTDLAERQEPPTTRPTTKICLDTTAMMGLCSDLLHYALPPDEDAARRRFLRPKEMIPVDRAARHLISDPGFEGQSQNSRELVRGILEETRIPMIEEIRDTVQAALDATPGEVEFWTTHESAQYLREAFSSEELIGDGMEQQRFRRLVGLEEGDFFEGSRYEGIEGCLRGMRVRLFDPNSSPSQPNDTSWPPKCFSGMSSFHTQLADLCSTFLAEYYAALADPALQPSLPAFLQAKRNNQPKLAPISLPFSIVSLHTFARAAAEGMTTLTMGNIVFRELWAQSRWRAKGWCQGNHELEDADGGPAGNAVMWHLPYRSLGEGKRVRFEKGDYSFPKS